MRKSREDVVELEHTRFYHCISRCVRRAFLCGRDSLTGKNFKHRREWMLQRIKELGDVFAIKICAYAIMENHYHLVLYVDLEESQNWTDEEVVTRWQYLFKFANPIEEGAIEKWRSRLADISWFMRCLNEPIARMANKEDKCKGRFWEGRFKCQSLLDQTAVLACTAYVDLNPIRAAMNSTPESSEFTSIQERIKNWKETQKTPKAKKTQSKKFRIVKTPKHTFKIAQKPLMAFPDCNTVQSLNKETIRYSLPVTYEHYLKLVDWSGRAIQKHKRGAIPIELAPIMERLKVNDESWLKLTQTMETTFANVAGTYQTLKKHSKVQNKKWFKGIHFFEESQKRSA
jgi:REP element-mobilizing transposase RayT